jgi:predicted dehydrogenase
MTMSVSARLRPLRLVQVGMGGWGRAWMAVTASESGVETVGYVDPAVAARTATIRAGVSPDRVFSELETALQAARPDAVLVTTSIEHHVPITLEALAAGLHVLVEKPFAPTLDEAVIAVRAAGAAGRTLMVSQNYRYHPAPRLAAELVAKGEVGPVASIEVDFRRHPIPRTPVWARRHRALNHPLLADMAIHQFDLLRLILGREPLWVEMEGVNPPTSGYRDPPAAFGLLSFEGDVAVSYRGSWISSGRQTRWGGEWRLEGANGALEWTSRGDRDARDRLRLRTAGGATRPIALPELPALDRAGSLAAFVEAVRSSTEPETSGRRNLPTLALTLAAIRSATERRRVGIAELLADVPEDLR